MARGPGPAVRLQPALRHARTPRRACCAGCRTSRDGGVLWLNGDVVFDPAVLEHVLALGPGRRELRLRRHRDRRRRGGQVHPRRRRLHPGAVQDRRRRARRGRRASTTSPARTRPALIEHLDACGDQDYFERAIETAIELEGLRFRPLDISAFSAVEVDFETRPRARQHAVLGPADAASRRWPAEARLGPVRRPGRAVGLPRPGFGLPEPADRGDPADHSPAPSASSSATATRRRGLRAGRTARSPTRARRRRAAPAPAAASPGRRRAGRSSPRGRAVRRGSRDRPRARRSAPAAAPRAIAPRVRGDR